EDRSGAALHDAVVKELKAEVVRYAVVADDWQAIHSILITWTDEEGLDLILTTGGTGFAPRDITPEVTRSLIEREAPGLVFAMVQSGLRVTPYAMLTRAVAGIRRQTLIINLPGSPKAALENFTAIAPTLPHAIALLRGAPMTEEDHVARSPVAR
ncbi:MAG: MogA/MoaB family molybdenum cofactor biosynthesis protein, partial [Anaerolineae bacterium]|nr:MogA/MoaB family molybdenum cofactor biosynthesis protein [Anaerolineae bacterium]MDW8072147.1 MogA/MoaB family molybdenum cofactor biosynthesis protein [Anaerolineae bacterium]